MSSKITVYCVHCGGAIRVLPSQLGREVRCSHCKNITALVESHDTTKGEDENQKPVIDLTKITKISEAKAAPVPKSAKRIALKRKDLSWEDSDDLTPMVDVTFLLLIFFMVTAAFALQRSLEVPPPESETESAQQQITPNQDDNSVIVRILRDNSVWIEDRKIPSRQQLLAELKEMVRPSNDMPPIDSMLVFADGSCRYETVVMVLDAGNAVSMKQIQLKTEEQDDP